MAERVTKGLLRFTRSAAPHLEAINIAKLIARTCDLVAGTLPPGIELQRDLDASPRVHLLADAGQLEQVICNLIYNARDALSASGRVRIGLRVDAPVQGRATIEVEDDGTGIPEEAREQVFQAFYSTKAPGQGTGLGMHNVREQVEALGGEISLESEPGFGTRVSLHFPMIPAPASASSLELREVDGAGRRVLLAEDSESVRATMRSQLEAHGFVVVECADGRAALDEMLRNEVDVLVLDNDMPEMSGTAALMAIREAHPNISALLISGLPLDCDAPRTVCLTKPISGRQLSVAVDDLCSD